MWSLDAGEFRMPPNVSLAVGGNSTVQHLVLQVGDLDLLFMKSSTLSTFSAFLKSHQHQHQASKHLTGTIDNHKSSLIWQCPKNLRNDDDQWSMMMINDQWWSIAQKTKISLMYIILHKSIPQVHYISNQRIPETGDTSGVMIEYQVGTFRWILTKMDFD